MRIRVSARLQATAAPEAPAPMISTSTGLVMTQAACATVIVSPATVVRRTSRGWLSS
jgi:hypothetical protein